MILYFNKFLLYSIKRHNLISGIYKFIQMQSIFTKQSSTMPKPANFNPQTIILKIFTHHKNEIIRLDLITNQLSNYTSDKDQIPTERKRRGDLIELPSFPRIEVLFPTLKKARRSTAYVSTHYAFPLYYLYGACVHFVWPESICIGRLCPVGAFIARIMHIQWHLTRTPVNWRRNWTLTMLIVFRGTNIQRNYKNWPVHFWTGPICRKRT